MGLKGMDHYFSYDESQPGVAVSCRTGYTEHHLAFALAHGAVLGSFLHFGKCAPRHLRGIVGGFAAYLVAVHVLLGGVCRSRTISAAVHAQFASHPVVRLSISHISFSGMVGAAVAAHFVNLKSEGVARTIKLVIMGVLLPGNILAQYMHLSFDELWNARTQREPKGLWLVPHLCVPWLLILSLCFIYQATRTRSMFLFLLATSMLTTGSALLNSTFPIDLEGRLMNYSANLPESNYDDQNLHWAVSMRFALTCTTQV